MGWLGTKLLRSWLVLYVSVNGAVKGELDASSHIYTYAYLAKFNIPEDSTAVACVDSAGCASVVFAPPGCKSCFDAACASSVQVVRNVSQGEAFVFEHAPSFLAGSVLCSTGQVNALSGYNNTMHEWNAFNKRGTLFAYIGTPRRVRLGYCGLFSAAPATVLVREKDALINVKPWTFTEVNGLNVRGESVVISSSAPILVACWRHEGQDFAALFPMTEDPIFLFDSRETMLVQADCNTHVKTVVPPSCRLLDPAILGVVDVTLQPSGEYFEIVGMPRSFYSGSPHECQTTAGNCAAMLTLGDGFGFEATSALPELFFASYFVVPTPLSGLFVGSRTRATCTLIDDSNVTKTVVGHTVAYFHFPNYIPTGSVLSCDRDVFAIGDTFETSGEFNLNGKESAAAWEGHLVDSLTSAPSATPTVSPSRSPVSVSTSFDIKENFAVISGSLGAAICAFVAAIALVRRRQRSYPTGVVLFPTDVHIQGESSMVSSHESGGGGISAARQATISEELMAQDIKTANGRTAMERQAEQHRQNSMDPAIVTVVTDDML